MPDIRDDVPADPQPAALPAPLVPDPFEQASRTVAARPVGGPVRVLFETDARRIADQMVRQATKLAMDELDRVGPLLAQATEALELWGAFDYELTLLGERHGIEYPPEMSPLDLVQLILDVAIARAAATAVDEMMSPTILQGQRGGNS
jgi:hypothetical protein